MSKGIDRWLGVELRHLETFFAVARAGSFSQAALKLGYTQSAVSHQIASLERIVGVRLLERPRGRRPVSLTEHGTLLLGHAERILATLSAAEAEMQSLVAGQERLRVGIFQSVGVRVLWGCRAFLSRSSCRRDRPAVGTAGSSRRRSPEWLRRD
jgi:DNA-binding transcriptional LysR family regulator